MPLETATYIHELDASNPTGPDPKSQGDDQLRLLKSTLQNTFPNIEGAVDVTHTLLNNLTQYFGTGDVLSPAAIASNQNDYNPPGLATAFILRLTSSANVQLTGLAGVQGRFICVYNANALGGNTITLNNEDALSAASNRFGFQPVIMGPTGALLIRYDTATSRWRRVN